MSLFGVIAVVIVVGLVMYLAETYVPMAPPFKLILRVVVVAILVLWLLQVFGLTGPPVPRLR